MRTKDILLTVGFLSLIGAAAALSSSNSFAAGPQRVDVVDSLPAGNQSDGAKAAGDKTQRVDVIDSVGANGSVYPFTSGTMRVDLIDRIEPQKPLHSSAGEPMSLGVVDRLLVVAKSLTGVRATEDPVMRVDVIDSLPTEAQWDSATNAGGQARRVDVIDSPASRGPVYPSTSGAMRVDVIERPRS